MKKLAITITWTLLAILLATLCLAEDRNWEEANSLLVKASGLEAFKPDAPPKFHLRVNFALSHSTQGNLKGTFDRDFVLPEHWSDALTLGDIRQNRVRIDKKMWTSKNAEFMPLQVDFLFQALFTTSFRMTVSDSVDRLHNRNIEGVEARCIEFHNVQMRSSTSGELCVERDRGALIYWKYGTREIWYSQYMPFSSALRPTHLVVAERGATSVEADASYTEAPELTADGFLPLKNGEVTDVCSTSRDLIPKSTPDPTFPPILSRRQFPGKVIIKVEVDENGLVIKEAVVESVHPTLDGLALAAVKSWVFEPKLCDGKPVSTTTRLDVHFR